MKKVAIGGRESSGPKRKGLEMKSKKRGTLLCHVLVSSNVALVVGFLGLGVRAFAEADISRLIFMAAFASCLVIFVVYLMLRRPTQEMTAHSLFRASSFVKRDLSLAIASN